MDAILPLVAKATQVIVISEVEWVGSLDPDYDDMQSINVPTRIAQAANEAGVPVTVMSISLPYDCAAYPDTPAVTAVFGNKGIDPTEGLKPSSAFGPNVPAGIEVLMGGRAAQDKLPVDLYNVVVDEDGASFNLDSIAYPFRFGLEYHACGDEGPEVDKSALQTATDDIEANIVPQRYLYTAATYAVPQSALDAAHAVLDDGAATQEQVNTALAALNSAREGLVFVSVAPDPTPTPTRIRVERARSPTRAIPVPLQPLSQRQHSASPRWVPAVCSVQMITNQTSRPSVHDNDTGYELVSGQRRM